jgi:hypothetical protein
MKKTHEANSQTLSKLQGYNTLHILVDTLYNHPYLHCKYINIDKKYEKKNKTNRYRTENCQPKSLPGHRVVYYSKWSITFWVGE